jgi:DNA recombination protein RmuC
MIILLYIIIGAIVGAMVTYLLLNNRLKDSNIRLSLVNQSLAQNQASLSKSEQESAQMMSEKEHLRDENTNLKVSYESKSKEAQMLRDDLNNKNSLLEESRKEAKELNARCESQTKQIELLNKQTSTETQLRQQQFDQQLKTVQEQFSNLANKVLNETTLKLKNENSESIENITKPLKENISQLHQAITDSNNTSIKNTTSLSEQLKAMKEQTEKIDSTATNLTNVLRGNNKQMGDWGEFMLNELLDSQGFKRGLDYDVQDTITDERGNVVTNDDNGKRMRPDVILHYPNNEDVVIDAKVSIKAYSDYVNATDEIQKRMFLDKHLKSLRSHVRELVNKDYSNYIKKPRQAIDFVIMFVPNDNALNLAFSFDTKLWQDAFEGKVFITGPQNLFAILRMIQIAWRQHNQTENQRRIISMAEEMLKRVGEFIKRYETVGGDISKLVKNYEESKKKLYNGKQSIVQKANEMKEIGIKESINQPIPEVETELEIEDIDNKQNNENEDRISENA